MKKWIALLLVTVLCVSLAACGSGLSGEYCSENGNARIEFKSDGTCTWHQKVPLLDTELTCEGTYQETEDGWTLYMHGGALLNFTLTAVRIDKETLLINGLKDFYNVYFYKQ